MQIALVKDALLLPYRQCRCVHKHVKLKMKIPVLQNQQNISSDMMVARMIGGKVNDLDEKSCSGRVYVVTS